MNATILNRPDNRFQGEFLIPEAYFYINECLCYDDPPQTAAEGVSGIKYFLGYWFIRKAMWAGPTSIRENAASLKKFCGYLTPGVRDWSGFILHRQRPAQVERILALGSD